MMTVVTETILQAAAIPMRKGQICLITSRSGKRWVIPKGCFEPGKSAGEIALQETWEEAGLTGVLRGEPFGSFVYEKFNTLHHVTVFLMAVTDETEDYPEHLMREKCWLSPRQAIARVDDPGLREILEQAVMEFVD